MIPKFSSYFYPFLKNLKEIDSCSLKQLSMMICRDLGLNESDLEEVTRSGSTTKHKSNLNYCAAYLKKMGLVERPSQGNYKITLKGLDVLEKYGDKFSLSSLRELPEFILTQFNPKNSDMVCVKAHKKGNKIIGAYVCRKEMIRKDNPNVLKFKSDKL